MSNPIPSEAVRSLALDARTNPRCTKMLVPTGTLMAALTLVESDTPDVVALRKLSLKGGYQTIPARVLAGVFQPIEDKLDDGSVDTVVSDFVASVETADDVPTGRVSDSFEAGGDETDDDETGDD